MKGKISPDEQELIDRYRLLRNDEDRTAILNLLRSLTKWLERT